MKSARTRPLSSASASRTEGAARVADALPSLDVFTLSRRMGTSLAMIDATYGHLAPDAEEQERALLDAFDLAWVGRAGQVRASTGQK